VLAGLFVTTIARTMSSVVLKAASDGLAWRGLRLAMGIQLAASAGFYVVLSVWGEMGIRLMFERGSFDAQSTEAVQRFLMGAFPGLALLGILDLLIVYANGRRLAVARQMFVRVGGLMVGSAAAACIFAVVVPDPAGAPILFVSTFAVTALGAASLAVWQEGRAS
jgi:peptidoglycan biosynthesis protein MviN/MurJ (putative lipid II flippase)